MAFVSSVTSTSFTGSRVCNDAAATFNGNTTALRPVNKTNQATGWSTTTKMTYFSPMESVLNKWSTLANSPPTYKPPANESAGVTGWTTATTETNKVYYSAMDSLLTKYDVMSKLQGSKLATSKPSSIWKAFVSKMSTPLYTQYVDPSYSQDFEVYMYSIQSQARRFIAPGGSPSVTPADNYMAGCISKQVKQTACSTGVYTVACTEGTVSGQADQSRVMALGKEFKLKQRSTSEKFGTMYEMRKKANALAHGCEYEESLYNTYSKSAMAAVRSYSESTGACSRSAVTTDKAEQYMMMVVDRLCKQQTMMNQGGGVYNVGCSDGTVQDMAEDKRVIALSAKFRAGQASDLVKAQRAFDRKKFARDLYAHECSYEEDLFNKYPAMAASMSTMGSSY